MATEARCVRFGLRTKACPLSSSLRTKARRLRSGSRWCDSVPGTLVPSSRFDERILALRRIPHIGHKERVSTREPLRRRAHPLPSASA